MAASGIFKFNYYRRYRWRAQDFDLMQNMIFGHDEGLAEGLIQGGVTKGFDYIGATGLNIQVNTGIAMGPSGDLLASNAVKQITLPAATGAGVVRTIVVARTLLTNEDYITKPTNPFELVPLKKKLATNIVAISGVENDPYPSKLANDVIILGVENNNTSVVKTDLSKCELVGKNSELRRLRYFDAVVGNQRFATHRNLAEAVTGGAKRIRVVDSEVLDVTIPVTGQDVHIELDQGVRLTKGLAATGFSISASGFKFKGGSIKGYSSGVPIRLQAPASGSVVADTVFIDSPNTVVDESVGGAIYGIQSF